jgi:hypothetical protein
MGLISFDRLPPAFLYSKSPILGHLAPLHRIFLDVRLQMLNRKGAPVPDKVYRKLTQVQPRALGGLEATIRFTSVVAEAG